MAIVRDHASNFANALRLITVPNALPIAETTILVLSAREDNKAAQEIGGTHEREQLSSGIEPIADSEQASTASFDYLHSFAAERVDPLTELPDELLECLAECLLKSRG